LKATASFLPLQFRRGTLLKSLDKDGSVDLLKSGPAEEKFFSSSSWCGKHLCLKEGRAEYKLWPWQTTSLRGPAGSHSGELDAPVPC